MQCAPARPTARAPDANELSILKAWSQAPPLRGWVGRGRARLKSRDGEVEGQLTFALDPPARARLEVKAGALFGMVGERVVVALPGDEHILVYRERSDTLERVAFAESALGDLTSGGDTAMLFELIRGRAPWPGGVVPADLAQRTRLLKRASGGRELTFRVPLDDGRTFVLSLRDEVLEHLELWLGAEKRLDVEYERWRSVGDEPTQQPMRLRIRMAQDAVKAEFQLESLEPQQTFSERDFEVY